MSEKWYWKHRGELRGPFETEDLASLVRQRRIFDRDQLRLDGDSEWLSGKSVKEMFAGQKPPKKVEGKSSANNQNEEVAGRSWQVTLPGISLGGILDFFADRIAFLLLPILRLILFFCNRRVFLVTLFLVLATVVSLRTWSGGARIYRSAFQEMMTVWDDLEGLRVHQAKEAEWYSLRDSALPRLEPVIRNLQADARRLAPGPHEVGTRAWKTDFTSRKLLSASQTLREVLNRLPAYDLDKTNFVREMNDARDLLTGAELRVITEPPQRRVPSGSQAADAEQGLSIGMKGLLIFDALLLVAGVGWYIRSRR